MSQPKVILYTSKTNSDGTHPIVIRWYENGKPKKRTVANVHKNQWSEKSSRVNAKHPMAAHINTLIADMLGEAIVNKGLRKKKSVPGIVEFTRNEAEKAERLGGLTTKNAYGQLANDLVDFDSEMENISFDDFAEKDCENFYIYLLSKNSKNTAARKMSRLGTMFRRAKKAKITINDPLFGMSFAKERTIKTKLTRAELDSIVNLPDDGLSRWAMLARDIFTLQFYLRGTRVGDVLGLLKTDIQEGKAVYKEGKTGQIRIVTLRPEALKVIDRYKDSGSSYVFPVLKFVHDKSKNESENMLAYRRQVESATTQVNKGLVLVCKACGITKKVTTHIARHTFAKLAIDKLKNPRLSQELVGHKSLRVHQDYIRDLQDNDELDQAADDVFGD